MERRRQGILLAGARHRRQGIPLAGARRRRQGALPTGCGPLPARPFPVRSSSEWLCAPTSRKGLGCYLAPVTRRLRARHSARAPRCRQRGLRSAARSGDHDRRRGRRLRRGRCSWRVLRFSIRRVCDSMVRGRCLRAINSRRIRRAHPSRIGRQRARRLRDGSQAKANRRGARTEARRC